MADDRNERIGITRGDAKDGATSVVSRHAFETVWKSRGFSEVKDAATAQVTEPTEPDAEGRTKTDPTKGSKSKSS